MKKTKSKELLQIGLLMVFLSIVFLSTKFYFNTTFGNTTTDNDFKRVGNLLVTENANDENKRSPYINEEYLISFSYPSFLSKKEYTNVGGYDFFVRFEESEVSKGKGVAFGVKSSEFDSELERIKNDILNEGEISLTAEKEIGVGGEKARLVEFVPNNKEVFEARSLVVVKRGEYTYSFSTVPDQIQTLIESVNFLN